MNSKIASELSSGSRFRAPARIAAVNSVMARALFRHGKLFLQVEP